MRAEECATKYAHKRPDGRDFESILDEGTYEMIYEFAYENIAYGQSDADSVVKKWLSSKDHKAAILLPEITLTGIGCYTDDQGYKYWCQLFVSVSE